MMQLAFTAKMHMGDTLYKSMAPKLALVNQASYSRDACKESVRELSFIMGKEIRIKRTGSNTAGTKTSWT
jgi:hypothetical protein